MIFQCAACRALVRAESVAVDVGQQRAGLACDACRGVTWLPFAGTRDASRDGGVVDVTPGEAPPVQPALPASVSSNVALATVPRGGVVMSGFSDDVRARIEVRVRAMEPAGDAQKELAGTFEKLLRQWGAEGEHKQFLKKASMVGELAFAGQRYRAVLDEAPSDAQAKKAQNDILGLAMASLSQQRDFGSTAGEGDAAARKKMMAAAVIVVAAIVCIGILFYLPRILNNALDDGTQPADSPVDGNFAEPGAGR